MSRKAMWCAVLAATGARAVGIAVTTFLQTLGEIPLQFWHMDRI
jgi:hypothetical protein